MLKENHLPNEYWSNLVVCSVYILNKIPTKSVKNQVPQEAWSGKNNNISHLRIFGCVAYAHVPKDMRRKLDDISEKCVFVGYNEESKAYRLYNHVTKKYVINRDNILSGGVEISHEDDDGDEQVVHDGKLIP
jgi:hypothetical protein